MKKQKKLSKSKFPKLPVRLIIALFLFFACLIITKIKINEKEMQILGMKTEITNLQKEAYTWEKILREKPDYRDGWLQLAALYYELGNKNLAKQALSQAKTLDPTSEVVAGVEKLLAD
ncbi:MAG: tetratricopeptide repeat protein [Patescibacteria group bacterium]|nr:tetratricopeptide repeat protein [Patescibacteria group bacterium]